MKQNIGIADRAIRLLAGAAIIGAGIYFQSWWGAIGLIFIVTAALRFCPPYALLGINSCGVKGDEQGEVEKVDKAEN